MNFKLRIKYIKQNRSFFDKVVIYFFKKTFLRYADRHLAEAKNSTVINSFQLHELDAQMKEDLKRW